jgi:HTH-type transcriptional regulator/antitoxin HigA
MESTIMDKRLAEAFPPGDYLAEELEERGWSQADFAAILGRPVQFVSEIVSAKKEITRESAAQIGAALGTSAEVWLNLQNTYLLWKHGQSDSTQRQLSEVRRRARLNELAPVALLKKRGILRGETLDELETDLMDLLEIGSLDENPEVKIAARRANDDSPITNTQRAWVAASRRQAKLLKAKKYNESKLREVAVSLAQRLTSEADFRDLPRLMATAGVRLVYVESFPGSRMTGASFLLDNDSSKPVIALSGRGRRLDIVLFTVLHEIAHLIRGDVRPGHVVIDEEDNYTLGDEQEANKMAAGWAVPGGLNPPTPIRQSWILEEAERLSVHPIVVIGQLQRRELLEWRTQLVKGAPSVTDELALWSQLAS